MSPSVIIRVRISTFVINGPFPIKRQNSTRRKLIFVHVHTPSMKMTPQISAAETALRYTEVCKCVQVLSNEFRTVVG